jgi:tryptophan synthase alpha chain
MNASNARLAATFAKTAGRTALVPYITAGDPSKAATPALMHALVRAGADVLELGVPFSDPMADGPVIQRAAERAIKRGVGLPQVLEMVAEFRQQDQATPVVLMGYANPIERMGQAAFVERAGQAGVDGVLAVDYPPEEITEFAAQLGKAGIDPIFLLAPTSTEERIKKVAQVARGYVYYVSLKGVTGAGNIDTAGVAERLALIRRHVSIPVGVGFGIRDADSARRLASCADAVVIGSKLIETMETAVADTAQPVRSG